MKSLLLIALLCLLSSVVAAQTDSCAINLKRASADYDQGDYDHAISTLNVTLKGCDLSKQDQIQANKLLILCYLHIDNLEAANSTADVIMKIDPTYTPDKFKDDPKLVAVFSKFKPVPIFAVGIAGGGNSTRVQVLQTYSVVYDDDAYPGEYKPGIGFQLSAFAEQRLIHNLWIHGGFAYRRSNYEHRLDSIAGSTVNYSERLSYLDFPVQLKYDFFNKAVTPFLYAGVLFSFLNSSISTTKWYDTQQDLIDRSALRNSFFIGYTGGGGMSYQFNKFKIFLRADYTFVPKQLNKQGTRFDDLINLYKYYYIDDDFRLHHACISIGGTYYLVYRNKKQ